METLTPEAVLFQLRAIATTDATDIIGVKDGQLQVTNTQCLTPSQKAAIASVEKSTGGVKIKLYDKLKALELLCKLMGLGEASMAAADTSLLDAILRSTGEVIDTHDLSELQQAPVAGNELVESAVDS
jgi:hypothetical protein